MTRFPARTEAAGAAAVVAAAVLLWALAPTYPNYDAYYHLVWGRELLDGMTPSFEAYAAPTQHPLYLVVAAVLGAVVGEHADRALVLLALLGHAATVIGLYRLGAVAFGRWAGVLAAVFAGASASFLLYAVRGYVDSTFLALVVWAGVLAAQDDARRDEGRDEARAGGPPRPWLVALLLGAAGLLRPEAWILAGLWWLWRMRLSSTLALVVPPLAWALVDLWGTGDPLHSLNATSALAEELGRERGIGAVPGSFASFISATVRPPVAALAVVGAALALWRLGWRRALVPFALLFAGIATFAGTGIVGLSILPRYLTVPALALCLFAGFALAGWAIERDPGLRRRWRLAAGAATALGVVVLAVLAPSFANVRDELTLLRGSHADLVALLDDPAVTAARRCGPVTFPNYRLVPDARWHLDAPREALGARSARARDRGVAVFVLTRRALRRFGFADGASPLTNVPGPGFVPIARHGRFAAYAACPPG